MRRRLSKARGRLLTTPLDPSTPPAPPPSVSRTDARVSTPPSTLVTSGDAVLRREGALEPRGGSAGGVEPYKREIQKGKSTDHK